jgi:hypothetical protein
VSDTEVVAPRRPRRVLVVVGVVVAAIIGLNLVARGLDEAVGGNEPSGRPGSSYATTAEGLAAYATLLTRYDHTVSFQRGKLVDDPPPTDSTVFVMDPEVLTEEDAGVLLTFATNGGRLVIGGPSPFYLSNLRDQPPAWSPVGYSTWDANAPELGGDVTIETAAYGSWTEPGSSRPVVRDHRAALVTTERVGVGEIWFVADPSFVTNEFLAREDNATVGIELAGDRPVIFAEGVHGFGETRGFSAIPTNWKWALFLLGVAALALVWSRARRFGPPNVDARDLPPARSEYVEALSTTLERTHQPAAAMASTQAYARDRIAARTALGAEPNPEQIVAAARVLGCTDEEIAALSTPVVDDAHVLALGRAVARVTSGDRRME